MITRKYSIIFLILSLSFMLNLTDAARPAFALTISATASWSSEPGTATYPDQVINGPFTIFGSAGFPSVGDGIDENTKWIFNFTSDPNYTSFLSAGPLAAAILTMKLIPKVTIDDGFGSDEVKMGSFDAIGINSSGAVVDAEFLFTADFMQSGIGDYTSNNILNLLTSNSGIISMEYWDDAWVKEARLDLTSVPIPSSLLLLGSGLLGMWAVRRKYRG